jgi:hypothetical protein
MQTIVLTHLYIQMYNMRGCRDRDSMVVVFYNYLCNLPITTNVVSSNPTQARCTTLYDKVCQYLRQVGGFLWVLRFPPSIKLTATI